ncbi:hypothetical protein D1872_217000 [compost metagenome]
MERGRDADRCGHRKAHETKYGHYGFTDRVGHSGVVPMPVLRQGAGDGPGRRTRENRGLSGEVRLADQYPCDTDICIEAGYDLTLR